MISVEHVSVSFGGLKAVDDVSFDIPQGAITGLIGPNGAGKSTVFNAIAGHVHASTGKIRLGGEDITSLAPHERAEMGLARTFQIPQEFSQLTVIENFMAAASTPKGENVLNVIFARNRYGAEERETYGEAREMVSLLEIEQVMDEKAGNLSGGQKKLLELGRALMRKPKIILLDEIGAGINRTLLAKISDKILMLNRERGLTFCLIEHDLDYVSKLCDDVVVLVQGQLLTRGSVDQVRSDERVIEAYFGGGKYEARV
jgi:branched-chain amino acid transport system ATP-binding protein